MQLNRPKAKICFKLDLNRLLVDFFDPKSSPDLIKILATIWIRTQILNPNSIYIKNWSNLIKMVENEWISSILSSSLIKINLFNRLIDFFDLLIDFFDLLIDFFNLLIKLFDLYIELFNLFIDLLIKIDRI